MAAIAEQRRRRLEPAEYAAIVERTRAVVEEHVPAGAILAVVSRGDDALVALAGRRGWHFPRVASGAYAGHHPPDSAAAIAHLEELRASGAGYLVLPASAHWWLDHYEQLATYLRERCTLLVEDPACTIFSLGVGAQAAGPAAEAQPAGWAEPDLAARERLRRFLDALLPERCRVLVAGSGWDGLALGERAVLLAPAAPGDALAAADAQRRADVPAYFVLPLLAGTREQPLAALREAFERSTSPLAERAGLALVFDLHAPTTTDRRVPA